MNWTFSTLGCPDAGFGEALRLAKSFSLKSIEIRTLDGSTSISNALKRHFGSPENAAKQRANLPAQICSLNSSCEMLGSSPKKWQELVDLAPWADALNIKYMRVFDGKTSHDVVSEAQEFQYWWNNQKRSHGWRVDVMIETHSSLFNARCILAMQEQLTTPINILWDSHHTWLKGNETPIETWNTIKQWVCHIHVKDSKKPASNNKRVQYTLPGEGDFPFDALFSLLRKVQFTGPISLEWEKHWHPELPELSTALDALQKSKWWH